MKLKYKSAILITLLLSLTSCAKSLDDIKNDKGEPTLIWSDEFDYTGLPDESKWSFEIASPGWGNNELQYYTDSINNAEVKDGALTITLKQVITIPIKRILKMKMTIMC